MSGSYPGTPGRTCPAAGPACRVDPAAETVDLAVGAERVQRGVIRAQRVDQ
jgi:hypothetical protein